MRVLGCALFAVGFVLLLPLWFPIATVLNALERRRFRRAFHDFACVECATRLGQGSIELATRESEARNKARLEAWGNEPLRLNLGVTAICPVCGAHYLFHRRDGTLHRVGND